MTGEKERKSEDSIQALIRDPTPAHLLDALEQCWLEEAPASKFGILSEYVNRALESWRTESQDDSVERLMELLGALKPQAIQHTDRSGTSHMKEGTRSGSGQELIDVLRELTAPREGGGSAVSALSWYPYGEVMREYFTSSKAPEIAEVWQAVDRLLPLFLFEQPEESGGPLCLLVQHATLDGYDELIHRMIQAASRNETEALFLTWLWDNRELDSGDLEECSLSAVPLTEAACIGQPAVDALLNALSNKDPNSQGWPLGVLDCLVLFTRLTVREIGGPLDSGLETPVFRKMVEQLNATDLLGQRASSRHEDKLAHDESANPSFPSIGAAEISISSMINLLPDQDFQPWSWATQIFSEMLVNDADRIIRSRDGDLRMPWPRSDIVVLRLRLASVKLMNGAPVEPALFREHWWAPLMLNDLQHVRLGVAEGLLIRAEGPHRDSQHPAVVTKMASGIANEGWPLLANALLAYHLIAHALSKEIVAARSRWADAIRGLGEMPGSHMVRTALRLLSAVGVDETTREWATQFVTSDVDLRLMEGPEQGADIEAKETMMRPWRKEAEREIAQCLGGGDRNLLEALHSNARGVLVDHWLSWKDAAPDFGSGRHKAYPELIAGLFRVFEVQLREALAPAWRGESEEAARAWLKQKGLAVGDHFDASHFMILLRDPANLPAAVRSSLDGTGCDINQLGKVLRQPIFDQLRNARNNASHQHSASAWKVMKLREQVIEGRGAKGLRRGIRLWGRAVR